METKTIRRIFSPDKIRPDAVVEENPLLGPRIEKIKKEVKNPENTGISYFFVRIFLTRKGGLTERQLASFDKD